MSYEWDQFNRGKAARAREARKRMSEPKMSWISNLLTNVIGTKIRKGLSKAGGVPGMIMDYTVGKIIEGASGQEKNLDKDFAFLTEQEKEDTIKGINKAERDNFKSVFGRGISEDIDKFGKTYDMTDKEAKQAYFEMLQDPENLKGFLTGKEFDPASGQWITNPNAVGMDIDGNPIDINGNIVSNEFIPDPGYDYPIKMPKVSSEDITLDEIDFDEHGNLIEKKNIFQKGKEGLEQLFKGKHAKDMYDRDEVIMKDGLPYVEDRGTYENILGNLISRKGITKYSPGLNPETLMRISEDNIFDFDVEDPEGYQEILDLIQDLDK